MLYLSNYIQKIVKRAADLCCSYLMAAEYILGNCLVLQKMLSGRICHLNPGDS